MGLVYGNPAEIRRVQCFDNRWILQLLRREVKQTTMRRHVSQDRMVLGRRQIAVQHSRANPLAAKCLDLIELQRLQRREDKRQLTLIIHHRRQLVQQRFAARSGHKDNNVAVAEDCFHRRLLLGTQVCNPQFRQRLAGNLILNMIHTFSSFKSQKTKKPTNLTTFRPEPRIR